MATEELGMATGQEIKTDNLIATTRGPEQLSMRISVETENVLAEP
jgi:hypothetical protein